MSLANLRSCMEFARLSALIKQRAAGRKVFYVPNDGNWGDGLINHGTIQFLQYNQIPFTLLNRRTVADVQRALKPTKMTLAGSLLLAGGGGAWCNNYPASRQFVEIHGALFDHVVVLPTTFELPAVELPSDRITYFRRDEFQSAANVENSVFCHDMAFFLSHDISSPGRRLPVGNLFREDKERNPLATVPVDNLDISSIGNESKSPLQFFRILSRFDKIKTDRMHVAIASCLLGIECELFPGNYFKSNALYHSSIRPNYNRCSLNSWQ